MQGCRNGARKRRVFVAMAVLCAVAAGVLVIVAGVTGEWTSWLAAAVTFVSASSIWSMNAWRAGEGRA